MGAFRNSMKSVVVIGSVIAGLAVAIYPAIIAPYMNPIPWREMQRAIRETTDREKIQPGGMKVWTDPFDRKKD